MRFFDRQRARARKREMYLFVLTNSDHGLTFCRRSDTQPRAALPAGVDVSDTREEAIDADEDNGSFLLETDSSSSSIRGILISMSPLKSAEAMM